MRSFIKNDFVVSRIIVDCSCDKIIIKLFRKFVDGLRHARIAKGDFVESLYVIDETRSIILLFDQKEATAV